MQIRFANVRSVPRAASSLSEGHRAISQLTVGCCCFAATFLLRGGGGAKEKHEEVTSSLSQLTAGWIEIRNLTPRGSPADDADAEEHGMQHFRFPTKGNQRRVKNSTARCVRALDI